MGFPCGSVVKNLPANAGDARDTGSIPGLARSPGEGNGNPLQYSCLGNSIGRGAWPATVHGVSKNQDMTEQLNAYLHSYTVTWISVSSSKIILCSVRFYTILSLL